MKLSEAIREGSKLRPQAFGHYYHDGGTCVEGAAVEGVFGHPCPSFIFEGTDFTATLRKHFPFITRDADCPVCLDDYPANIDSVMLHLNDTHLWTREAIADWIDTLESRAPSTQRS